MHIGRGAELAEGGGVEELSEVFLGDLDALQLAHALGGGHGVDNQIVVRREVVSPTKKVVILIIRLFKQSRQRNRRGGGGHGGDEW